MFNYFRVQVEKPTPISGRSAPWNNPFHWFYSAINNIIQQYDLERYFCRKWWLLLIYFTRGVFIRVWKEGCNPWFHTNSRGGRFDGSLITFPLRWVGNYDFRLRAHYDLMLQNMSGFFIMRIVESFSLCAAVLLAASQALVIRMFGGIAFAAPATGMFFAQSK